MGANYSHSKYFGRNHKKDQSTQTDDNIHDTKNLCKICYSNTISKILIPCGHFCVCNECSKKLLNYSKEKLVKTVKFHKLRKGVCCPICKQRCVFNKTFS